MYVDIYIYIYIHNTTNNTTSNINNQHAFALPALSALVG